MLLSTLAFIWMAFRTPVVSDTTLDSQHLSANPLTAKATLPRLDSIHHHLRYHFLFRHGYRWRKLLRRDYCERDS